MVSDRRPTAAPLTVLYDGACPLCRREMQHMRRLSDRQGDAGICFADIAEEGTALPHGTTRPQLLARFHVVRDDGSVLDGAAAFVEMWSRLPGWRWAARVARWPGMLPLLELAYRGFLRLRPALQRLAARRG